MVASIYFYKNLRIKKNLFLSLNSLQFIRQKGKYSNSQNIFTEAKGIHKTPGNEGNELHFLLL